PPITLLFPYTTLFRSVTYILCARSHGGNAAPMSCADFGACVTPEDCVGLCSYNNTYLSICYIFVFCRTNVCWSKRERRSARETRSEEHTSELQSRENL